MRRAQPAQVTGAGGVMTSDIRFQHPPQDLHGFGLAAEADQGFRPGELQALPIPARLGTTGRFDQMLSCQCDGVFESRPGDAQRDARGRNGIALDPQSRHYVPVERGRRVARAALCDLKRDEDKCELHSRVVLLRLDGLVERLGPL
jgi:hypothetical protein